MRKIKKETKTVKLYYHKTDGGAEYLCTSPIEGTNEGDLFTTVIRIDGQAEFLNSTYAIAPELLAALEKILTAPDYMIPQIAREAIAKAKGE